MKRQYFWNPKQGRKGYGIHTPVDKTMAQCLRSKREDERLLRICNKNKIDPGIAARILCSMDESGKNGITRASQKLIAEKTGYSVRTVAKYQSILRQNGYIWVEHKYRETPNGARRTTSIIKLTVLTEYCERCAAWVRKSANFINTQASKITKPFKNKGKRLNAPDASLLLCIYSKTTGEILNSPPHRPSPEPAFGPLTC